MYHILEALSFPNTPKYSDVGNRNHTYAMLDEFYSKKSEREIIELRKEAGYRVFYKNKSQIDLYKTIHYHDDLESIEIASLIKNSPVSTLGGICNASDTRPALFDEDGLLKVFTVSDPCKLIIGSKALMARAQSVVQLTNEDQFGTKIPLMIDSIYVEPDFKITNQYVDLIASKHPNKKSKLVFNPDGSGEIISFIQFIGEVNFRGQFYNTKDYYNLYRRSDNSKTIASMTLTESIFVLQAGQKNQYTDLIQLSEQGHLLVGTIKGEAPKLTLGGKLVDIMPGTKVLFFEQYPDRVVKAVLRYSTKLLTIAGTILEFPPGQELTLTPEGLVR
jgi:hypothetical protein